MGVLTIKIAYLVEWKKHATNSHVLNGASLNFLIHSARYMVDNFHAYKTVVCPSYPAFQYQTNFQVEIMFATGMAVGLAEKIIDGSSLVYFWEHQHANMAKK